MDEPTSMFGPSSKSRVLYALQSQFTCTPLRLHPFTPNPNVFFIPVSNSLARVSPVRKKTEAETAPVQAKKSSSKPIASIEDGDDLNSAAENCQRQRTKKRLSVGRRPHQSSSTSANTARRSLLRNPQRLYEFFGKTMLLAIDRKSPLSRDCHSQLRSR